MMCAMPDDAEVQKEIVIPPDLPGTLPPTGPRVPERIVKEE